MHSVITRIVIALSLLNAVAATLFFYARAADDAPTPLLAALLLSGSLSSFLVLGFFTLLVLRSRSPRYGSPAQRACTGCAMGIAALWLSYLLASAMF